MNKTNRPNVIVLDRPHRFKIGDLVHHVDDAPHVKPSTVTACTLTNTVANIMFPTYILRTAEGEELFDILCTKDLETTEEHKATLRKELVTESAVKRQNKNAEKPWYGTPLMLEVDEEEGDIEIDTTCAMNVGGEGWRGALRRVLDKMEIDYEGSMLDGGIELVLDDPEHAETQDVVEALRVALTNAGFHVDVEVL